jgi:hypothetical protein
MGFFCSTDEIKVNRNLQLPAGLLRDRMNVAIVLADEAHITAGGGSPSCSICSALFPHRAWARSRSMPH